MSRATELADALEDGPPQIAILAAAALLRTQDEALREIEANMGPIKALLDKWGKE